MENVSRAELSPDGKTLAFFRDTVAAENATGMTLWLASPPESPPVAYVRAPFGAPNGYSQATLHFSPDGSKLGVWAVATLSAETTTEPSEFWVLPVGNGAPRHVPSPVPDLHGMAPAFSWLPDNRRVLSAVPRPQPGLHMWLMVTERGDAHLLVSTAGLENDPAVSPNGTRLALTLQQADFDLYQLSLDRSSPSVVLATSRNEMDPTWSAALTAMAFTTDRNGREEIWLRSQKGDFERPLVTPDDFAASRTDFLSAPKSRPTAGASPTTA
jgi:Tol biopolymer transport system component